MRERRQRKRKEEVAAPHPNHVAPNRLPGVHARHDDDPLRRRDTLKVQRARARENERTRECECEGGREGKGRGKKRGE